MKTGSFTNVSNLCTNTVKIVTVDVTKDMYIHDNTALFPRFEYRETIDAPRRLRKFNDCARVYTAKKLDPLLRIEQIKDDRERWLFRELCKISGVVDYFKISKRLESFEEYTEILQDAANWAACHTYGSETLGLECTKRNVMVDNGKLILNDIFYCSNQLKKVQRGLII